SLYAWARDDRALRAPGRTAEATGGGSAGNDGSFAENGGRFTPALQARRGESGDEYRQSRGGRGGWAHPHACFAALGGGRQFRLRGRRDSGASGDAGGDLGED